MSVLSEADARNSVMSNCIYIDRGDKQIEKYVGKYVILNAAFHHKSAHGLEYLSFTHISDMKLWPPQQEKRE